MRQDVKKLGKLLASGIKILRQIAENNGQEIYSQIQNVTFLEIITRPQLCFSFRTRKTARRGGGGATPEPKVMTTDPPALSLTNL